MMLNERLNKFVDLLNLYWEKLSENINSEEFEYLKNDWLQANWELIVERNLVYEGIYLEVYGEGADCNGASSRVLFPDKVANYNIILRPKDTEMTYNLLDEQYVDLGTKYAVFQRFVTFKDDGWYYEEPPFDKVEAICDGKIIIVNIEDINMILNHK